MEHRNLTISLHRKQIFNVFLFKNVRKIKKNVKKRKKVTRIKNVKNIFCIYAGN